MGRWPLGLHRSFSLESDMGDVENRMVALLCEVVCDILNRRLLWMSSTTHLPPIHRFTYLQDDCGCLRHHRSIPAT